METKKTLIFVGIVAIIIFFVIQYDFPKKTKLLPEEEITLLEETKEMDYNSPEIQAIIQQMPEDLSDTQKTRWILDYVYENIEYSPTLTVAYCLGETASSVSEVRIGDCSSMSKLAVALLRGVGIPSKTVSGCVSSIYLCYDAFAITLIERPELPPMVEGDFKLRGNIHLWVDAYIDEKWVLLEPSLGKAMYGCNSYMFYKYPETPYYNCVNDDVTFWDKCYGY